MTEQKLKRCPIPSAMGTFYCMKNCAWWIEEDNGCAMMAMVKHFSSISNALEFILEAIQKQ